MRPAYITLDGGSWVRARAAEVGAGARRIAEAIVGVKAGLSRSRSSQGRDRRKALRQ